MEFSEYSTGIRTKGSRDTMNGLLDKIGTAAVIWWSALLAQSPAPTGDMWAMIDKFGLPTVLTVTLLIGWYRKENRAEKRHNATQLFVQNRLVALVEDSSVSKREVASALNRLAEIVGKCPTVQGKG